MLRGFFSGAFWGLLVGALTLAVAALVIEARQAPRQSAEAPVNVAEAPDWQPVPVDPALMQAPSAPSPDLRTAPGPRLLLPRPGKPVLPGIPLQVAMSDPLDRDVPDRPVAAPPLPGGPSGGTLAIAATAPNPGGVGVTAQVEADGPPHEGEGPARPLIAGMPASPAPLSPPQNGPGALPPPALATAAPSSVETAPVAVRALPAEDALRAPEPEPLEPLAVAPDAVAAPAAPLSSALAGRQGGFIAFVGAEIDDHAPEWMLSALARPDLPDGVEPVAAFGLDVDLDGVAASDAPVALTDPAQAATRPGAAPLYRRLARAEDVTPQNLAAIVERVRRDGSVAVLVDTRNAAVLEPLAEWLATGSGADLTPVPLSFLIR
ncbi:MAG: hypothetical protein KDA50_13070 [Rhodobacteraceae bacterium]|nr:hypothetical protein [Paracoccaceae bacterium]